MLCEAYASDFKVPVTILRPFNIYGPGQSRKNLIPQMIRQVTEHGHLSVQDLSPKRDFLYLDDLITALMKVILVDGERDGLDVFNLGYGVSHSVADVIHILRDIVGREVPVHVIGKKRPNEVMDCYCDHRKFSRRYGWKPGISLETGITKLLSHTSHL
jgi:nucleoside-diphosphate-sugar epimerase